MSINSEVMQATFYFLWMTLMLICLFFFFEEIKEFGNLAGFFINYRKMKIICKNMSRKEEEDLQKQSGCEVAKMVKYLGIYVTGKNVDIFKNNYERL